MISSLRGPIVVAYGAIRSGKTTTADYLVDQHGFMRHGFADALRLEVANMIIDSGLESMFMDEILRLMTDSNFKEEYRPLLRWWGAYRRKHSGQDYWVLKLLETIMPVLETGASVVIDDCRYTNEYIALRRRGAVFFHLQQAPNSPPPLQDHESEMDWPSFRFDESLPWEPVDQRAKTIVETLIAKELAG